MLSINTNLSSLITQRSMNESTNKLNQAIERMTTGFKINHAKDNAANYNIATNMTTQIGSYNVAADNVAMGMDLVTTASDTIALMQNKAERLRALCTQARNGTYGAESRSAINTEAGAIMAEINRLYSTAQYNGVALFTGGTESAAATPAVTTFAMPRAATTENYFIADPITYSDEEVAAMTTMTELVAGTTSATNEYSISTKEELVALANYVNNTANDTTGMTFVLGADIDLSSISNWTPIGDYSTNTSYLFKGIFDGNGHVIKNLTIDNETKDYQGLFGYTRSSSVIKNVGIEHGSIKGKDGTGGLVGLGNEIINCYTTVTVSGGAYVGGLAGRTYKPVTNCYATGDVSGSGQYVGGLTGRNYDLVTNSYATGDVTNSNSNTGGLVGCANGNITNSYATGTVSGNGEVGGLAGSAYYVVNNCYATGAVSGTSSIGGLIGYYWGDMNNCYATGTVSGDSYVGGLVGSDYEWMDCYIANSYATGDVNCSNEYAGGLIGYLWGEITKSYATGNVTSSGVSVGGLAGQYDSYSSAINSAAVQLDSKATLKTEEEIKATYIPESMGFTEANGWTIVGESPIQSWQTTSYAGNSGATPTPDLTPGGGAGGGATGVSSFSLQIGVNGDSSCQIGFDTNFTYDLSAIEVDISSDEALATIDDFINLLSEKQTHLGAVQNRLESALDSIEVSMNNLTSSLSTIRDADIAEVSSAYIRQQILQQASATLMSTANQSASIALSLI